MKKVNSFTSLNAFLGVYGVKTSKLMSNDDYWVCAIALWPSIRRQPEMTLDDLQAKIKRMPLKDRRIIAKRNVANLPPRFLSFAPKHQRNLARSLARESVA